MAEKSVTIEMVAKTTGIITNADLAADSVKNLATSTATSGVTISSSMEAAQSSFTKSSKKLGEDADTLKSKLEQLREEGGRRSGLGEFGELLKGAGAVAGVSILGEVIKNAAEKAEKLNEEFREGKLDAAGMAVGIGESLPVIGSFVEAGQAIREIFTHEKADLADINEEIKAGNEVYEQRKKIIEANEKAEKDAAEELRKSRNNLAIDSAITPADKKAAERSAGLDDRQATHDKDLDDFTKKTNEETAKLVEKLRKDGADQAKIAEDKVRNMDGDSTFTDSAISQVDARQRDQTAMATKAAQDRAAAEIAAHKKVIDEKLRLDNEDATKKGIKEDKQDVSSKVEAATKGAHDYLKGIVDSIAPGMKKITQEQEESWRKQKEAQDEAAKKVVENSKKLHEEATQMLDEANTPLEKFEEKIAKVTALLKGGTINKSEADKLDNKALADFDKETGGGGGFAKAPAPINENRRGALNLDPAAINPLVQVAKDQLAIAKQQAQDIQQIRTQTQNSGTPVPYTGF